MNKKTVMVFGTFDYLHFGHVRFLEHARALGDTLIVIIGRDKTVHSVKGKKSRNNESQRVRAVRALGIAHTVVLGHNTNRLARIQQYTPDIICLGYDQKVFVDVLKKHLRENAIATRIVRAPAYKPQRHKSSLLKTPAPLVRGIVQKGLGESKKLGFPTANVAAPAQARKGLARGIYAARVLLGTKEYLGAAAVGVRTEDGAPLVEVHILGIAKNLYGKTITLMLDKKIRGIRTYKTSEALQTAIQNDVARINTFYKNTKDA